MKYVKTLLLLRAEKKIIMPKRKRQRFEEMKTFPHVFQPDYSEIYQQDYPLKGKWSENFFKNANPLILELGCGKGEYTVGMARSTPDKNYIGIDIKGARMWKGAKESYEQQLKNVAFVRTRVEFIDSLFAENEISEIWLTFPDPQINRMKKRLTSASFLNTYKYLLRQEGKIHLKTDSNLLFKFTKQIIQLNQLRLLHETNDLYASSEQNIIPDIKTFYEMNYLDYGLKIKYLCFSPGKTGNIANPEEDKQLVELEKSERKRKNTHKINRQGKKASQ